MKEILEEKFGQLQKKHIEEWMIADICQDFCFTQVKYPDIYEW